MVFSVIIAALTCGALILSVCIFPQKKIGKTNISLYAAVPFIGAVCAVAFGLVTPLQIWEYFTLDASDNPVKIIILFISTSVISVYLDETGFFEYIAHIAVKKTGGSQLSVFLSLYITAALLTVVTSNDIVILTFTPFICQFCKRCNVNAAPYVFSQFVAANTWSLLLIIGNPTNIFLSLSIGAGFMEYLSIMWLPTVFAGLASLIMLLIVFRKSLAEKMRPDYENYTLKEPSFTAVGLSFLIACTASIAVLPYFDLEMYYAAAFFCIALILTVVIMRAAKRQRPTIVAKTLARAPFEMIPLVLGMAVIALSLSVNGVTAALRSAIGVENTIIKYGVLSALVSNVVNNIPMSMIFADITGGLSGEILKKAVYSSVIGSNIGAYLTPLGALAGLMFTSILSRHQVRFSFKDFIKYGVTVAPVTLLAALAGLYIILL